MRGYVTKKITSLVPGVGFLRTYKLSTNRQTNYNFKICKFLYFQISEVWLFKNVDYFIVYFVAISQLV